MDEGTGRERPELGHLRGVVPSRCQSARPSRRVPEAETPSLSVTCGKETLPRCDHSLSQKADPGQDGGVLPPNPRWDCPIKVHAHSDLRRQPSLPLSVCWFLSQVVVLTCSGVSKEGMDFRSESGQFTGKAELRGHPANMIDNQPAALRLTKLSWD